MGWLGRVERAVRPLLVLALLPLGLIFWSAVCVVTALFGGSPRACHVSYLSFARGCLRVAGTTMDVRGLENLERDRSYLVVSTHESNWDSPVLLCALHDLVLRFIVKQQLMRIPVFGYALKASGSVTVVRRPGSGDVRRIEEGMSKRPDEVSVVFYPEGTRTRDGSLGSFKMGAFATAISSGLPILPVAIAGTRRLWAPDSAWLTPGPVTVEIGEPFPVAGLTLDDRKDLRDRVHARIAELRARARDRLRDAGVEPGGVD